MRADERQAAVAYAYAWWTTGDDDTAAAALRAAISAPDPAEDTDQARLVALMTGIRTHLGDTRAMPPASELALLHDGFDVPLEAAADLSLVPRQEAATALAAGRLEALLETVREDFRHPEQLGGLALGHAAALAHAEDCRSCTRARALIERGRVELRAVSPVSAPPGLIASLVAEFAPPIEAPADAAESVEPTGVEAGQAEAAVAAPEAEVEVAAPGAEGVAAEPQEAPATDVEVTPAPEVEEPEPQPLEKPPAEEEPAEAGPALVPATPARRRTAGILAGAGVLTLCVLVGVLVASSGNEADPGVEPDVDQTSEPTATETSRPSEATTEPALGPDAGAPKGFSVSNAGLLLSGAETTAPSGARIGPREPLRVAVDYVNATKGVKLYALWRIDDKVYDRLHAVVSAKSSRHVWGLPVPPDGWPPGRHRIVVTANDNVAAAIDFTVRAPN